MILVAYWWPQAHIPTLIVYQALKFLKIDDVLDKRLLSLSAHARK